MAQDERGFMLHVPTPSYNRGMAGVDGELTYLRELVKMLDESLAREQTPEKETQLKQHLQQTLSRLETLGVDAVSARKSD